jgi:hypothetical protein
MATLTLSATPQAGVVFPDDVTPVDTSRITAQWSYYDEEGTGQAQWKVKLYSAGGGAVLETRTGVGTDTSVPLTTLLLNGGTYRLGVSVQDGTGLWSPETTQDFTVAYALPDVPTVSLSWDDGQQAVVAAIGNPTGGTGAAVDHNELWRSVDWQTYELVADSIPPNGTVTDYIPALGSENVYKVIAVTAIEAAAASVPTIFEAPPLKGWFLLNGGDAFATRVGVRYNPQLSRTFNRDKALNKFAGRKYPVESAGEGRNRVFDLSVSVFGDDDATLAALEAMADIPGPLVLRTPMLDRAYVSLEGIPSTRAMGGFENVSLKMTQVDAPNTGTMVFDPVVYRTNWAANPSFADVTNQFYGSGVTTTIDTTDPAVGTTFLHATYTGTGGSFQYAGQSVYIPTGYTYVRATIMARNLAGSGYLRARLGYRDLPTTGTITYGAMTTGVAASTWTTLTVEAVIPATTQYLNVLVYAVDSATGTTIVTGTEWGLDGLCVELGTTAEDTGPATYFDGDTWEGDAVLNPRWTGTPNASTSELTRGGQAA